VRASENPFFHRGPILDPAYFFGRTHEIGQILNLLSSGRSCCVVGGAKRGKTSILLHLQRDQTLLTHGMDAAVYLRPYLSMEGLANAAPEAVFHCLLREALRCPGSPTIGASGQRLAPMGNLPFAELETALARLADAGRKVVFLLDNLHAAHAGRGTDPGTVSALRELASHSRCAFVFSAEPSTETLGPMDSAGGSAERFAAVHLRRFEPRDLADMVRTLSERAGRLWDVDLDRVMDWTGGVPYLAQLAFSLLWTRSEGATRSPGNVDYEYVFREFTDQAEPFLHAAWRGLSDREREALLDVAGGAEIEHDAPTIQGLVKADLLAEHEGRVVLSSRAVATFVQARLREREHGAGGFLAAVQDARAETSGAAVPDDKAAVYGVARALVEAIEYWDRLTSGHSEETARLAAAIAARMGLSAEEIEGIGIAARLCDIGKIGVSDRLLLKPDKLTEQEREAVRSHVMVSTRILEALHFPWEVKPAVRYHHERLDGSGYPDGLMGDDIPLGARVLAVADVFTAMTAPRSHRSPHSREDAIAEITKHAGTRYDPQVVAAFVQVVEAGGP
jgi:HD-GYP domain-containing protein (c-di-GMP phosphodiesterase class II)